MEAQVSDNENDTTDEESSVYSGLEDDEDEDSVLESFDDDDGDDDEDDGEDEDDDEDEEEDGEDDSSAEEMSTNEDENLDSVSVQNNGKTAALPTDGVSSGTSIALLKPIEDEYAQDSSDEEV